MPDAWELQPVNERTADAIATFILFCEDKVNEPSYFQSLQKDKKVKINIVEDVKSDHLNLLNTIDYCIKNGLMESVNGHYRLKDGVTEHLWCVYDRDAETEDKATLKNIDQLRFSEAIATAAQKGLNVAWSNDVFELWILLHFEDVPPGEWQHRSYIYDRLTQIFRALPDQSVEMLKVTSNPLFNYKEAMKRKLHFISFVRPLLASRLNDAIERALTLEKAFPQNTAFHECNPCTKVHHLVNSILSFH